MSGVEYKVLELMRFINEDMVDAHLLEVNDCILVLLHLILNGGNLGGKVFFTLDKTFQHTAADVVALLFQHFEVFFNSVKFSLKDLLLHFR